MRADMNNKSRLITLRLALSGLLMFHHLVGGSFALWSFAILSASVFSPPSAHAAIPPMMNFQGRLTDSGGNPRNGNFDMAFRIYDASSGGNLLWDESYTGANQVTVING